MKMKDYQDGARSTAIYPEAAKLAYPVLGLVGEIGELEKALQYDQQSKNTLGEIGDVLWYCANTCCDLEAMLTDCFQASTLGCVLVDMHASFDIIPVEQLYIDDVIIVTGRIAEAAKKIIRDKALNEKREIILTELGGILKYLQSIAVTLGSSLDEIAAANLAKLQGRKERGTIKGDGEDR